MAMKPPAVEGVDDVLEYAAQLIEEVSFTDLRGIAAKRKRAREDAALRLETAEEIRKECAQHIRAMKSRPDLDAKAVLARIANSDGKPSAFDLVEAWPLAWKGWLRIDVTICTTTNQVPPPVEYTISLTDRGRAVINGAETPRFARTA